MWLASCAWESRAPNAWLWRYPSIQDGRCKVILSRVSIDSLCGLWRFTYRACVCNRAAISGHFVVNLKKMSFILMDVQERPSASSSILTSTSASFYRRASPFSTRCSAVSTPSPTLTSFNCFSSFSDWFVQIHFNSICIFFIFCVMCLISGLAFRSRWPIRPSVPSHRRRWIGSVLSNRNIMASISITECCSFSVEFHGRWVPHETYFEYPNDFLFFLNFPLSRKQLI